MLFRARGASSGETTQILVDDQTATQERLPDPPPPPVAPLEEPPPDRDLWPWLLALLVIVLAGIFGAWLATRHKHENASPATTAARQQTVAAAPRPPKARAVEPKVPRLVGMPAPDALAALRKHDLVGATRGVFSTKPRNLVVGQKPATGITVAANSTVTLTVSKGAKPVPVPDVTGQDIAAALPTIKAQSLRATVVRVPNPEPSGQVVAQHPRAGATAAPGSSVRLNVSGGTPTATTAATSTMATTTSPTAPAATVTVPDLRGEAIGTARQTLRRAGLVTEIKRVPNALPKDTVVSQSPKPGSARRRGDHVFVTVSLGSGTPQATNTAQAAVPDVVGEDEATATQDLQQAGLRVQVVDQTTSDQTQDGLVIRQDPASGRSIPTRTNVTIYVGRFDG
jgi:beta-lactam-binding protein with PASTA domain